MAYGVVSLINSYLVNINGLYMTFIVIFTLAFDLVRNCGKQSIKKVLLSLNFFHGCNNGDMWEKFHFSHMSTKKKTTSFLSLSTKKKAKSFSESNVV